MAKLKTVYSLRNDVGGVDLITEKDSGNLVRVLTGNKKRSLEYWQRLEIVCQDAIATIQYSDPTCPNNS